VGFAIDCRKEVVIYKKKIANSKLKTCKPTHNNIFQENNFFMCTDIAVKIHKIMMMKKKKKKKVMMMMMMKKIKKMKMMRVMQTAKL